MKGFAIIFCFIANLLIAQTDSLLSSTDLIQELLENSSIDIEEDYLFDQLEGLRDNPININKAGIEELLTIPFLDLNFF